MQHKREKGKFGLKIKTYQAGSVYAYSNGVRDHYDYKESMLTNSMFLNYMKENGLNIINNDSTRDIICVDFGYGTRSYEQEIKHLNRTIKDTLKNKKLTDEDKENKIERINYFIEKATENKEKFDKKSADEIRIMFYNDGLTIEHYHYTRKKTRKVDEVVHYKMLYRTPGKAKLGKVNFIRDELYDVARKYLYMGINLPKKNAPIVEIGAYSSLITSTIDINIGDKGRIKIAPEQILILKDVDSSVNTKVVSVETNKAKHCYAKEIDNYPVKNTMFDGQALIDSSIFPEEGDGYILLRQHFTKCAAFCTHIQKFFKDYYGDNYENAYIKDMFGRNVKAKDIRLITTDNAVKWLKFPDITFEDWARWIRKGDNYWGIVKTAHRSKFGNVQRMSYQMINALDIDTIESVCQITLDYITKLKTDNKVFRQYLIDNSNFSNDYEVLVAILDKNPDFYKCDYFCERKKLIISAYVNNFKTGKVLQKADNLVIVGNPYGMLMYSVGEDPLHDSTFNVEDDAIQCWTNMFKDGEYLAEFRNPFNSRQNLGHLHNVYNKKFDEYFELGNLCIAVNMNHTDFQDRNNGSDMDSDSIYTTNHSDIVKHARFCYLNYPTIVNNIPKEKNHYDSSPTAFAEVDNKLAASQLAIGMSSNLAQVSLSYSYNFKDKKYQDCVTILSVLAQAAIDNAKRTYDINIMDEINRLREVMDVDGNKYPVFWRGIRRNFDKRKINNDLECPMNSLYNIKIKSYRTVDRTIPIGEFLDLSLHREDSARKKMQAKSKRIEKMIIKYALSMSRDVNTGFDSDDEVADSYLVLREDFEDLVSDIRSTYLSSNDKWLVSQLLNRAFCVTSGMKSGREKTKYKMSKNKSVLLKVLYEGNKNLLMSCFKSQ